MLETNVTADISSMQVFDNSSIINFVILGIFLIFTFLLTIIVVYQTAHYIIRPLRVLNSKMRDII